MLGFCAPFLVGVGVFLLPESRRQRDGAAATALAGCMFFSKLFRYFSSDLGIDLGTANTLVCAGGRGIVVNEPSVVAVKKGTQHVLLDGDAIGTKAKAMLGRTPLSIDAVRPLRAGVIADFDMTEAMLAHFMRRASAGRGWVSPRVVISIPMGVTKVQKRAVFDAAMRAGARQVFLLEEPRAAGLGAGVPIHEANAHMIVDIGGGTTDIAILSLADVVVYDTLPVAGDAFDEAIVQYLKRNYNILVGPHTAEQLKIDLGSASRLGEEGEATVTGRDLIAGLPRAVRVTSADVREALSGPIRQVIDAIETVIQKTGPELAGDLIERGILLCGGGALLRGFDLVLAEETGLPVIVARDPLTTVARGTAVFLERLDEFKDILESADDEL